MFLSAIQHIIHRHLVVWSTRSRFVNGDFFFQTLLCGQDKLSGGVMGWKNGIDLFQLAQTADKDKKVAPIKTPSLGHLDRNKQKKIIF